MKKTVLLSIILVMAAVSVHGQIRKDLRRAGEIVRDSSAMRFTDVRARMQDTLTAMPDTISPIQDTVSADSIPASVDSSAVSGAVEEVKGTLQMPAFSAAKDSTIEDHANGIIYYFGEVSVRYGNMELKADYMAYDMRNNIVYARGTRDTITNEIIGMPEMTTGGKTYTMEEVYYNFKSEKARIRNMATEEGDGKIIGDKLKMMPDQSININGGKYTVCDAEHPHYYLRMSSAKVMTKPKQRTMFGPAWLVLGDVPIPFIALPFGFVPEMPDRASGILIPTWGQENARGMYLKDMGYSFVIGDYLDLAFTGDIYSYGSWAVKATSRYKLRYKFNGSVSLSYSKDVTGEKGSSDYFEQTNFAVNWSHSQDSKANPGTSFNASVNFSSPGNNRFNSRSITESVQNQASSSISYSKQWSAMSLSVNMLHSQNMRDSSYSFTLPNITFNVNRFYPFKRKVRVGKERFYEQISFSYNTTLQNKINFKMSEFAFNKDMLNKMQNGMTHNFTIGLPGFTLLKYLQFTPSVSYGMNWFFREQLKYYDEETQKVVTTYTDQFSTFGITQKFSAGLSMSTRIYGTFNFKPKSKLMAIRHMITPTFGFSWMPEHGTAANGFTTLKYVDANGVEHVEEYNKYSGMVYSPPSKGRTAALTFSFGNNLEAKVRKKADRDTGAAKIEKIKLLDQLNISGNYNFLADSCKLSNIGISASTTVFGKLGISGNMTLDPYAIDDHGKRCGTFNIVKTKTSLVRLTNASASLSYSINGDGNYKGNDGHMDGSAGKNSKGGEEQAYARVYYNPVTGEYIPGGWTYYLNPSIPWSLSFNYSFNYNRSYSYSNEQLITKNNFTQTIGISGQLRLTKALGFNLNTGFDLTKMKLTTTQLSASYDLHCFAISVSWVPNGQWASWSFRLAAKASALADLLQFKKASSFWDN